jgi:hypothetical protein
MLAEFNASGADHVEFQFGPIGQPVVGDWDGDGVTTPGVYTKDGHFELTNVNGSGGPVTKIQFGNPTATSVAVAGDWDGDGRATVGLFDGGTWVITNDPVGNGQTHTFKFGKPGQLPVVGDWDGDGTFTAGVYDPATGDWSVTEDTYVVGAPVSDASRTAHFYVDVQPVVGDWDGDGKTGIGWFNYLGWFGVSNDFVNVATKFQLGDGSGSPLPVAGTWFQ